jgi:hypothetical protein
LRRRRNGYHLRFFLIERQAAAPAEIVSCAELNEKTTITSNDFSGIYRSESRGHQVVGVARAGLLRGIGGVTIPTTLNLR